MGDLLGKNSEVKSAGGALSVVCVGPNAQYSDGDTILSKSTFLRMKR